MIRSSFLITFIFGLNTIAQLVNQIVTTRLMGAGAEYDIFLAAVTVPSLLTMLFASTLVDIGAPEYTRNKSNEWLTGYILFFTLIATLIAVLGIIGAPIYIPLLLGGTKSAIFISRAVIFAQIIVASLPIVAITAASNTYWYATKRVYRAPLVGLFGSILLTILSYLTIRSWGVYGLIASSMTSSAVCTLFLIPFSKLSFPHAFATVRKTEILSKWIPLVIGTFAMRSDGVLLRALTSDLPEGHFVYINIVYKVISAAAGLLSIGIQISLLSSLLDLVKHQDFKAAYKIAARAKILSFLVLLAVSLGIYFLGPFVIRTLYVGGKFSLADAQKASAVIPYFLPVLMGMGMFPVWMQPVLALRRQRLAGAIGVTGFVVAYVVGRLLPIQNPLILTCTILTGMYAFFIISFEFVWRKYQA
ncbi:MAG: lipid II flippase MurJ [Candidatus Roizmanbacteria bacterium]